MKLKEFFSKAGKLAMATLFTATSGGICEALQSIPVHAEQKTIIKTLPEGEYGGHNEKYHVKNGNEDDYYFRLTMDNERVYCVQPNNINTDFDAPIEVDPQDLGEYEATRAQSTKIKQVASLGYGFNGDTTHEMDFATQILIWQTMGYSITSIHPEIQAKIDLIEARIAQLSQKPSFNGQTIELEGFGAGSGKTLTDSKGIFKDYVFTSASDKLHYQQDGNNLKLWADEGFQGGDIKFTAFYNGKEDASNVVYYDGKHQAVAKIGGIATGNSITVHVTSTVGELSLEKQDVETGKQAQGLAKLDKAVYDVTRKDTGAKVGTLTYENGQSNVIKDLPIKSNGQLITYVLTETSAATGYHKGTFADGTLQSSFEVTFDPANKQNGVVKLKAVAKDRVSEIQLNKVDPSGNPVKGATLVLLDAETHKKVAFNYDGDDPKEWVTDGNPLTVKGLPIGKTYILQEIHAPKGLALAEDIEFTVEEDTEVQIVKMIDAPNQSELDIRTKASIDGAKEIVEKGSITITDTVEYHNLKAGQEYTMKGVLMDKSTEQPLEIEGSEVEVVFTPKKSNGTVEIPFTIDSSKVVGKDIVVYEELYADGKVVAEHKDINDKGQTVTVKPDIKIGTQATIDGEKSIAPKGEVTLKDVVSYEKLEVGKKYIIEGVLMDKETRNVLTLNGETFTNRVEFTAEKESGTIEVPFVINSDYLNGKTIVVFEKLYAVDEEGKETEVAKHEDFKDEGQTVEIREEIELKTTATVNGQKEAVAEGKVDIIDVVEYKDLKVGQEYTMKGVLMDKETGKALTIKGATAEVKFTPKKADGQVEMKFTINAEELSGKETVVFEELYNKHNTKIGEHKDINDKGQTVKFITELRTMAKINGQKEVVANGKMNLVDTVSYRGLTPGKEYTLKGVLMDKATGKALTIDGATAETKFTPKQSSGTVDMVFTIDTSKVANKSIVVFEELYDQTGKKTGEHKDINDKDQTVIVRAPSGNRTTTNTPKSVHTGIALGLGSTIGLAGLAYFISKKTKE